MMKMDNNNHLGFGLQFFFKLRFLAYISGAAEHTFTKLLPMVDLGCVQIPQYLGSCDVIPTLHGGRKNGEILHIFGPPYSHARTRQNIVILQEAQLMLTTGSTRLAVSRGQQTWYHSTCYI